MSYLRRSLEVEAERETCVVPFFVTTPTQRKTFSDYVRKTSLCEGLLPIYWQVEVADERNGWFPATAVNYRIDTHSLEVQVNEGNGHVCYHGFVHCDFRVVRLVCCSDRYSHALFNLIVRESVLSVRWEIDWLDCYNDDSVAQFSSTSRKSQRNRNPPLFCSNDSELSPRVRSPRSPTVGGDNGQRMKRWLRSMAYYYIRAINVLLIEDCSVRDSRGAATSFLLVPVNEYLSLHQCFDFHSLREFRRLIIEERIPCSQGARFQIQQPQHQDYNSTRQLIPYAPEYRPFIDRSKPARVIHEEYHRNSCMVESSSSLSKTTELCVICLEKEICNIAFIPCGHQVICDRCFQDCFPDNTHSGSSLSSFSNSNHTQHRSSSSARRRRIFDCPICRNSIHSYLKVYRA